MEWAFVSLVASIIWGVIWGSVTKSVIENKGYDENWFWWGFFFGLFAFIVALTKPDINAMRAVSNVSNAGWLRRLEDEKKNMLPGEMKNGSWKCVCGDVNPQHTGTCACGRSYQEVLGIVRQNKEAEKAQKNINAADEVKKLKELLDMGAITNDEFEIKKKELLNL